MSKIRIKVVGQLIGENPVQLGVFDTAAEADAVIREYIEVFPEIVITSEYGYFKKTISRAKAYALANLLKVLTVPSAKLGSQIASIARSNC